MENWDLEIALYVLVGVFAIGVFAIGVLKYIDIYIIREDFKMKTYMYDMAIAESKSENSVKFEKIMVKGFTESADLECDYGDICAHWLRWNPNGWYDGYSDWLATCSLKYSTFSSDAYIVEFMGAFDLDCKFEATGRGWFKITI